jgi:hypothetical protein
MRNIQRNAAADAPGKDSDIVPYEDEDLDTTQPDPNPQQQPVVVQVDTGRIAAVRGISGCPRVFQFYSCICCNASS